MSLTNHLTLVRVFPFLTGVDYCAKGHVCHANATCRNLQTTYACQCDQGFQGDGRLCIGMVILLYIFLFNHLTYYNT